MYPEGQELRAPALPTPLPDGLSETPTGIPSRSSEEARTSSAERPGRRDDRHAAAAPRKEWGPDGGGGSRSSEKFSQRAPRARTRRAWRSRSSGRRRRSAVPLAFACNRTWVRKIGGRSDGYSNLQGDLHPRRKVPVNGDFYSGLFEQTFPHWRLLAIADIGAEGHAADCGHVAVAALNVTAPRTPRSASQDDLSGT